MIIAMPSCKWLLWLAWGWKNHPGEVRRPSRKNSPDKFPSRRSCFKGKGKMVIFIVWQPHENDTIGTGSTNWDRGLWNHLNRSHGCGDTDVRSLGRNQIKTYSFLLLTSERSQYKGFGGGCWKTESVFLRLRFQIEKTHSGPKSNQNTLS